MKRTKLYVGNLSFAVSEDELQEKFAALGDTTEVKLIIDKDSGRSRGFGFVTYTSEESAKSALQLNGEDFNGRNLVVSLARTKDNSSGNRKRRTHRRP